MKTFSFQTPAVETVQGTAYFEVEAENEEQARAMMAEDASEYFIDFSETDSNTDWDADEGKDFKLAHVS